LGHTWCGILMEEVGELAAAVNDGDWQGAETELTHIAAVCQAAYAQSREDQCLDPQWGEFESGRKPGDE
jgi:NTP pyrophosphatase (non-canonical NTP hydrolase)